MTKQLRYLLTFLFLTIVGIGGAKADEVTFDATKDVTATANGYYSEVKTYVASDGSNWKATGHLLKESDYICIGKGGANYLETPEVSGVISSVTVTWTGNASYYLALQTTSGTELEAKQNVSDGQTYTFNVTGSYSQLRLVGRRASGTSNAATYIKKVVVSYTPSVTTPCVVTLGDDNTILTEVSAGAGVTLPSREGFGAYTFSGWSETSIGNIETNEKPVLISVGEYHPNKNVTLYPVYSRPDVNGLTNEILGQTLEYDTWSYSGETTDKNTYRMFSKDAYIISAPFNLSTLSKVNVYAGTFGTIPSSDSKSFTIKAGDIEWATKTVTTNSATTPNEVTSTVTLNGNGTLKIISNGGTAGSSGLRISKVDIFVSEPVLYYIEDPTTAIVPPVISVAETFTGSTTVTITCATEGATIKYSFDGENWSDYSEALTITATTTIYAKAVKDGAESEVAMVTATRVKRTPSVTIYGGEELINDLNGDTDIEAGTLTATIKYNDEDIDGNVTWNTMNASVATIDPNTGKVTLKGTGYTRLGAKFEGNDDYSSSEASIAFTVIDSKAPGGANNPYTVALALKNTPASGNSDNVYIKGKVSKFQAADIVSDGAYYRYYISDDGTTNNQLLVFKGKKAKDVAFSNADDLQIGDIVTIYGKLTTYNSTKEVAADNYIVSLERIVLADAELSFGETNAYEITLGDDFTAPTLSNPHDLEVTYASSNDAVATVDATGAVTIEGVGTTTITASSAATDVYQVGSASYMIIVNAKPLVVNPKNVNSNYYVKVTDVASLEDGDAIIFVSENEDAPKAMSTTQNANNRGAEEVTIEDEIINTPSNNVQKVVLVKEGNYFYFYTGTAGYLYAAASDKNYLRTTTVPDANAKAAITIDGGNTSITFQGTNTRNLLRYNPNTNNGSPLFACYKEATTSIFPVCIYKEVAVPVKPAAPIVFHDGNATYEGSLTVPMFAQEGATIKYTMNGGDEQTYSAPVELGTGETTITAWAELDGVKSDVVTKEFTINDVVTPNINLNGYYSIKNNGNELFVNVAGRKTVTFVNEDASKAAAGSVIKVNVENGQVKELRSQGVDIPGYAKRAMNYVPELVKAVVERLGENDVIGEQGLNLIADEFVAKFDYNLYLEEANGGYRIYGKTPSMSLVVDFYAQNKEVIDSRLPHVEGFVEEILLKVAERLNHPDSDWAKKFKVHDIWALIVNEENKLTEPVDEVSTAKFFTEVLSSEANIWNFAHETAMIYWDKVESIIENHASELGDYSKYLTRVKNVQPNSKYYIVADGSSLDFNNEANEDIKNNAPRTIWTLDERSTFDVTFDAALSKNDGKELYTTLYTDFAYTLPEKVKALKVIDIDETTGVAETEEITGVIPAQTPVLLMSTDKENLTKSLTLSTEAGTAVTGNLLVGADYLINEYKINSTQAEGVLNMLKSLSESLYNDYEYLLRKNAGTVNNKYFFGLDDADLDLCVENKDCVVRNLGTGENQPLAFYGDWQAPKGNQAFLVSETFNPILLTLKGDVDRDGDVDYDDVKALVKIVLGEVTVETNPDNYDFDAAKVNEDTVINIADVTALVNILLP